MQGDFGVVAVVAAILGAGGGAFGKTLVEQLFQVITGRSNHKRREIDRAFDQRDKAFRSRNIWTENFRKVSNWGLKIDKLARSSECFDDALLPEYPEIVYDNDQPDPPSGPITKG
ncbi:MULTISPECIES: hypothetical protein [unclassified Pseudoclavibacter]|uniref:hypothetical protein n=1 Tax=unclassified Pseudoclavibacter TaxID=2615177 RepID=UPI001BAABED3|nr:hypothetical protein [Pseudoclavibacter sp. Marseille-Q4354]MBS3177773.1 hypothetical protein [Pseudoclavibacter sp. Marseille-Q4354]